jgi:hypothetical protein
MPGLEPGIQPRIIRVWMAGSGPATTAPGGRHSLAFRREDHFPPTLRLVDVEIRVCLAKFLQDAIDGFKHGVEVAR